MFFIHPSFFSFIYYYAIINDGHALQSWGGESPEKVMAQKADMSLARKVSEIGMT